MHLSLSFALAACTLTLALSTPNQQSTPVSMNSSTQRTTQVHGRSGYQCITISQLNLCPVIRFTKSHFFLFCMFRIHLPQIPPKQTNKYLTPLLGDNDIVMNTRHWNTSCIGFVCVDLVCLIFVFVLFLDFVLFFFCFCFFNQSNKGNNNLILNNLILNILKGDTNLVPFPL